MIAKLFGAAVAASVAVSPAFADSGAFADVTGSTLGIGPELGYRLNDHLALRANATFLGFGHSYQSDDIDYSGHITLKSGGAMIDLHPFGGGFRLSGGFRINGSKARVKATPTGPVNIGDTSYDAPDGSYIRGEAQVRRFAPAASLGYISNAGKGFVWDIELGALFEGRIRIKDFTTNIPGVDPADLEDERRSVQSDVDDFKVYPIAQTMLGWRF